MEKFNKKQTIIVFLSFIIALIIGILLIIFLPNNRKDDSYENILDMYGTYEKDTSLTIPEMISVYTGPLYITGGAFDQHYTAKCAPTQFGKILSNSILIKADSGAYDTFSFEDIKYYKVTDKANPDTFYVMHMNSQLHGKNFEIVIELREGPHYNRVIYLFEEGQRYMMLFWKDKIHVTVPSINNEI